MKYISGMQALNLIPPENTPGDWHFSSMNWENPTMRESDDSPFGDWGIYVGEVPRIGKMHIANHLRACADLIAERYYGDAQGMRDNFIDNDSYNEEFFEKIMLLKSFKNWSEVDEFMEKEYLCRWLNYKEARNGLA